MTEKFLEIKKEKIKTELEINQVDLEIQQILQRPLEEMDEEMQEIEEIRRNAVPNIFRGVQNGRTNF